MVSVMSFRVKENRIWKLTKAVNCRIRYLVLLLGVTVTGAAVPVTELTVRPEARAAAPTTEQQLLRLQQQVQTLQAQLTAMQAIVQITPASTAGQEPRVAIAAGNVVLRASKNLLLLSGSNTNIHSSAVLELQSAARLEVGSSNDIVIHAASSPLNRAGFSGDC
jgi:hypothetical protein